MSMNLPPTMSVGRPQLIDDFGGTKLYMQTFQSPAAEFVDALRLSMLNKVACSFMPKIAESVEIIEMQETLRWETHELVVLYKTTRDLPDST